MKELSINELNINPCKMIGSEWMLVSAGKETNFNMMTASWGHIGALWGKHLYGRPTVEIFIRPCRHTDTYIQKEECFSLSFFDSKYHDDLLYLGTHSGKDENKLAKTHLSSVFVDGVPCYKEAKLTLICKKLYVGKIEKEGFIDKDIINSFYNESVDGDFANNSSFHNVYIAEIIKVLVQ